MKRTVASLLLLASTSLAQVSSFPHVERFDSVIVPALPAGWSTSTFRSAAGDFVTTISSPRSAPYAVLSTNATTSQSLTSPTLDFTNRTPTKLEFYTARSSTHTAGLLVEASVDNGASFPITLSDTIRHPGTAGYVFTTLPLPPSLTNQPRVRFRWRLVGWPGGGTSGTFRLDDVSVSAASASDLALSNLIVILAEENGVPSTTQPAILRATVRNVGTLPAAGYSVQFYKDTDGDAVPTPGEQFATVEGTPLSPSESTLVSATHPPLGAGIHRFIAVLRYSLDGNSENDTASASATIGAERRALVVNEIMFDPLPGQNEWVELLNRASIPVDLMNWRISDRPTSSGTNTYLITGNSHVIQPGDFVVIAAESSILSIFSYLRSPSANTHLLILNRSGGFGLNNDGDDIILSDAAGKSIDSVSYTPNWHHPDVTDTKGRSLERINPNLDSNDPRNWSTAPSTAGGTPGRKNDIYTTGLPSNASISINPNPFSPDSDGFEDFCIIRYSLPLTTSLIRISIFDIKGRLLRTLANSELSGPQGEIVWDGLDDAKQRVRIGPYIIFIEAVDSQGGTIATARGVAVVATKL